MKKIISILFLLPCFTFAKAQDALSLQTAIEIALHNNLNIKIANSQTDISKNNASLGNAGLLPSLNMSTRTNYSEHSKDEVSSSGALNFNYTLFNGLNARYNYKILNLKKEQAELTARYNIENIIGNVIVNFYSLSESYDNLEVAKQNLIISKERLLRNQAKYDFGNINKLEVLNAKVDFNRDSSSYLNTEQKFKEAVHNMNVLLGRNADHKIDVIKETNHFKEFNLSDLKQTALIENADYLAKAKQLKEDEINIKKARSSQLPSLHLKSSYSYYENELTNTNSHTQLTGEVSLTFNIFDGKKKKTEIANAKIQKQLSEYQYQDKMLQLEKEIIDAYSAYQYSLNLLSLEEDALEAAQLNFEQTKEYYQLGQVNSTRFREAQLNFVEAQNKKTAAQYNAKELEIEILRLSGAILKSNQ
jgi:outer membrane protein